MSDAPGPAPVFFGGGERAKILEQIEHLAQWARSVTLLTGPPGAGRTTLLTRLAALLRLRGNVNLVNPDVSVLSTPRELLLQLAEALGIEAPADAAAPADDSALRRRLIQNAAAERAADRPTLIVIDDAHELAPAVLEALGALIAEAKETRALNVLLTGDWQLRARIEALIDAHEIRLKPIAYHEMRPFVRATGLAEGGTLDEAATQAVYKRAQGWPGAIVSEVHRELRRKSRTARRFPYTIVAAIALIAALLIGILAINRPAPAQKVDALALPGQQAPPDPATESVGGAPVSARLPLPTLTYAPPKPVEAPAAKPPIAQDPPATGNDTAAPAAAGERGVTPGVAVDPNEWARTQPPGNFTLQLVGLSQREAAERFARERAAIGAKLLRTRRGGENWYLVLAGSYPDRAAADAALAEQASTRGGPAPWIRTFEGVQQELR